jgi:small subunit ribosomal protein S20
MPITKSAIKEVRKNKKRRHSNRVAMNELKLAIKHVRQARDAAAKDALAKALPIIDRAASSNLLKRGTADRYKSRLTKLVNQLSK